MNRRTFVGSLAAASTALPQSGTAYRPSPSNLKSREWFQNARFGMFIHWGLYSVLGQGEWVMNEKKIPIPEYEALAPKFNPPASMPPSGFRSRRMRA